MPNYDAAGDHNPHWKGGEITKTNGYIMVYAPDHPRRDRRNYVLQHIIVAEKVLGRYLKDPECIHHVDEDPGHNKNGNFVICEDKAYHMLIHRRKRAFEACGHANWIKCKYCKQHDDPKNMAIYEGHGYHRSCQAEMKRKLYRQRTGGQLWPERKTRSNSPM